MICSVWPDNCLCFRPNDKPFAFHKYISRAGIAKAENIDAAPFTVLELNKVACWNFPAIATSTAKVWRFSCFVIKYILSLQIVNHCLSSRCAVVCLLWFVSVIRYFSVKMMRRRNRAVDMLSLAEFKA